MYVYDACPIPTLAPHRVCACQSKGPGPLKEKINEGVGKRVLSVERLEHVSIHAIIRALVDGRTRDLARGRRKKEEEWRVKKNGRLSRMEG